MCATHCLNTVVRQGAIATAARNHLALLRGRANAAAAATER